MPTTLSGVVTENWRSLSTTQPLAGGASHSLRGSRIELMTSIVRQEHECPAQPVDPFTVKCRVCDGTDEDPGGPNAANALGYLRLVAPFRIREPAGSCRVTALYLQNPFTTER